MRTLEERFWAKVKTDGACWLWQGAVTGSQGYGQFRGKSHHPEMAHRVSWELAHGPLPDGKWVLHRCDVPRCVRPDHLYLGTPWDNAQDSREAGRIRGVRARDTRGEFDPAGEIVTVRMSSVLLGKLERMSVAAQSSRSDVIRQAVEAYCDVRMTQPMEISRK